MQAEAEKWRVEYRKRVEELETARSREIANMTDERALAIIRSLVSFGPIPANPANGMGLVEQQAIFHGLKQK